MKRFFDRLGKLEMRGILALTTIIGSFLFLFRLMAVAVPKENETLVNIIAGALIIGTIGSVMGYYFGNSKQNSDKDPLKE